MLFVTYSLLSPSRRLSFHAEQTQRILPVALPFLPFLHGRLLGWLLATQLSIFARFLCSEKPSGISSLEAALTHFFLTHNPDLCSS